ncbi:hypothetical protein CAPTEDRAFT_89782 [Capitella teleta]|uniref:Transmembrane protein 53 n=1 Tax=Capitella teleta TaxID=283909 RepID=R7TA92_CAPTE|nr:hypothetical protein CAPTEDRAFT_89782 [Capitella teleta]|eukprot:ELT88305.1 hypothetical protein CAPTEDRAFT_89782 [Capitella teleta]
MSDKSIYRIVYPQNKLEAAVREDTTVPVVLMLGWSGCSDKSLKKYSDIYQEKCIVIRSFAPVGAIFFKRGELSSLAANLLSAIIDLQLTSHPLFVHFFSNGGGGVYSRILNHLKTSAYFDITISGTIIDSAPAEHSISVAMKALRASLKLNSILKYFIMALFLMVVCIQTVMGFVMCLAGLKSSESLQETLVRDNTSCPQLFLYSKCDEICSYLTVENVMQARIKSGVDVRSLCWLDSPHVAHLKVHREAYITQCLQFIDHCLDSRL